MISFHSLEDRIAKHRLKEMEWKCRQKRQRIRWLFADSHKKTGIEASEIEAKSNPRSRSAKLRVAEKVSLC